MTNVLIGNVISPVNGAIMNFHVIDSIERYDFKNKLLRATVKSYVSQKSFEAGLRDIHAETFQPSTDQFKGTNEDCLMIECYQSISIMDFFKNTAIASYVQQSK